VAADHQNKPDVGTAIARHWFDVDHVDMVIDMPNSAVALAVQQVAREEHRVTINLSAASTELTGEQCSPTGMHWVSVIASEAWRSRARAPYFVGRLWIATPPRGGSRRQYWVCFRSGRNRR